MEYNMQLPNTADYKDLHAGMTVPHLTINTVEKYLSTMEKTLDKNAIQLYENNFVNYVRGCSSTMGTFFIKAEIRAQMKTHLVYVVDVCLSQDCDVGSPIKAENLILHVNNDIDFDPRPEDFVKQEGYTDLVRNVLINAQLFGQAPLLQLFYPANPYALNLDHDYFEITQAEQFLRDIGVADVSDEYIKSTEELTRDNRVKWKEERRKRLCSSSFGLLCKLTDRADKIALVQRMINAVEFRSKATSHGKTYEHIAVQKYEELTDTKSKESGLCVSLQHPFLASTPDRILTDKILVEVKCPYTCREEKISPQTVTYLYIDKDTGSLELKKTHNYYYQVQGQMLCTDAEEVDFVVYTFKDIKIIRISRDDKFIQSMLLTLQNFYDSYYKNAVLDKFFFRSYGDIFASET